MFALKFVSMLASCVSTYNLTESFCALLTQNRSMIFNCHHTVSQLLNKFNEKNSLLQSV